jgi:hypothetical protein
LRQEWLRGTTQRPLSLNLTDEWLDFTVKNRASISSKPMHDYDIVERLVASDDIAARIYG